MGVFDALIGRLGATFRRFTGDVMSTAIGFGTSAAIQPGVQTVINEQWQAHQDMPLSPAEAAAMVVQTILQMDEATAEAAMGGINAQRFAHLVTLSGDSLGPEQLIELLRRGAIDEATYEHGMRTGRVRNEWVKPFLAFAEVLLSPEELATMAVQGVISENEGAAVAKKSGISEDSFHKMFLAAGSPPGGHELLELWNRGAITESDVDRGFRQSRLKPEWTDVIKQLRDYVPTPPDVVRFAVREVYNPELSALYGSFEDFPSEALDDARRTALSEEVFKKYWAAHWDLPSAQMGYAMLHRGIIDLQGLSDLLRANDVMPYWRDKLIALAYLVPGRIDLRRMFREGVITRQEVYNGYLKIGYDAQDAERLTKFAEQEKLTNEKELTKAEIVAFYKQRSIPRDEAATMLGHLGYSDTDVDLILGLADAQALRAYRNAVIAVVRARYLDREIDEAGVTEWLDRVGVPVAEREQYLDLWSFARDENPTRLTEAQARAAFRAGVFDESAYRQYLTLLGYPPFEQDTLVSIYSPRG